jgi:hypothetical protein
MESWQLYLSCDIGSTMNVIMDKLETLVKELPDTVHIEKVMSRLYFLQKIEAGENALEEGRIPSHTEAMKRLSKKWRN